MVPDRTSDTMEQEIKDHIAPDTHIISDCWASYNGIEDLGINYVHSTVNHKGNLVDPVTHAHIQGIERLWRSLKEIHKRYEGIPKDQVSSHIGEFIWRQNEIGKKGKDKFLAAVELMANKLLYSHQ